MVFGRYGKKKHEKKKSDSQVSIAIYCNDSISGCTGPTILFLEGKSHRLHFTYEWLTDNGAEIGSTAIMTPTDFMEEEAQEKITPNNVKRMRNSDSIVA